MKSYAPLMVLHGDNAGHHDMAFNKSTTRYIQYTTKLTNCFRTASKALAAKQFVNIPVTST